MLDQRDGLVLYDCGTRIVDRNYSKSVFLEFVDFGLLGVQLERLQSASLVDNNWSVGVRNIVRGDF